MRYLSVTVLAAALATPAIAATPPAKEAKPIAEKKICRSSVATGSIMPKRVCRTSSEWAQIDRANADEVDRYGSNRPATGLGSTPGG
jgi:hypothetical protein